MPGCLYLQKGAIQVAEPLLSRCDEKFDVFNIPIIFTVTLITRQMKGTLNSWKKFV
jgi:hypothetical protein